MKYDYLVLDFNGTIIDDVDLCLNILNHLLEERNYCYFFLMFELADNHTLESHELHEAPAFPEPLFLADVQIGYS